MMLVEVDPPICDSKVDKKAKTEPEKKIKCTHMIHTNWISHSFSLVLIHDSILIGSSSGLIAVLRTNLLFTIESQELRSEVASDQPAFVLTDWELITAEIDSDVDATLGHRVQS